MHKIIQITGFAFLALILILLLWIGYIYFILPRVPIPVLKVELTLERIERGKYLANHVTVCVDCHSTRDWSRFSGPLITGTEGKGGEKFSHEMGLPGDFYSTNITPFKLSDWSDGEIFRAIVNGVGKGNKPLFPIMPYQYYRNLSTEDAYAIIAYIRTLPSIASQPSASKADFPVNIIMHTFPGPAEPIVIPPKSDTASYGKYLVSIAACKDCHTPFVKNKLDEKMVFAGGREFKMPTGTILASNITPDKETGIGTWTKQRFVARFKAFNLSTFSPPVLENADMVTVMPWTMYAGLDTTDLEAIFAYLKTQATVKHQMTLWTPSSK
ncbi:MAG: cytochrome C [Bacteroidetes bacterium]|nr:cytochrome C [Bacteroidota bacterium]